MNPNTRKYYINPNFRNPEIFRAHVNPLFAQSYLHNNVSYTQPIPIVQPKIHINPRMMNVIPNFYNQTGMNHSVPSTSTNNIVPIINNKYSKVNVKLENQVSNSNIPQAQTVPKALIFKPRKPNYSLIRNFNRNPVQTESKPCSIKSKFNNVQHKLIGQRLKANKSFKSNVSIDKFNSSSPSVKLKASAVDSVIIGGEKFVIKGNTLVRLIARSSKNKTSKLVNQISLNGKTFIRKSHNIFVANQSVKKLKKVNVPCFIYRQMGVCKKHEQDKCHFIHDRKHVALCRKFLRGACKMEGCLLSHDTTLEKMPTCKFYLEGCCTRSDCPYLHVKVDKNADVCLKFLQGYCESGKECLNVHVNVCPDFYKTGKCNKSVCSYPHKSVDKNISQPRDDYVLYESKKEANACNNKPMHVEDSSKRYYLVEKCQGESTYNVNECENKDNETDSTLSLAKSVRERPAIGDLPSFIAL